MSELGLLSADGYGERNVTVLSITHGVQVISGAPDSARAHRAFYISKRTSSTFSLNLIFTSHDEYASFGDWIQGYGTQASTPNTKVGSMVVSVPARNFLRVAVPVSGATFGDAVGQITYPVTLQFDGARETNDFQSASASQFIDATYDTENTKFFYPAGIQLGGNAAAEDVLYGLPGGTTKFVNLLKLAFGGGSAGPTDPAPLTQGPRNQPIDSEGHPVPNGRR